MILAAACLPAAGSLHAASGGTPDAWESGSGFNLLPRAFQKDPKMFVMTVTEFTAAGRALPKADPEHPQYYTMLDAQYEEEGDVVAGEEPPSKQELANVLRQSLAVAGYLPADPRHHPTLFIHCSWGSWNKLTSLANASNPDAAGMDDDDSDDFQIQSLAERAALVGGTKFAVEMLRAMNGGMLQQWEDSDPRTTFLMQEARDNRYFVIADAYDYAAATQQQRVLLWRTKISTNSRGITMNESVPQLVASAAPYFGHDTDGPVRLYRPVVKEGHVYVGVPQVTEPLPPDRPAVPPATPPNTAPAAH